LCPKAGRATLNFLSLVCNARSESRRDCYRSTDRSTASAREAHR
jgi:hypothetical protein